MSKCRFQIANIFKDHMVLQRNKRIKIWGTGEDKVTLEIKLLNHTRSVEIKDSLWKAEFPKMEAGGPYSLKISDGENTFKIIDIMIGEVWLCGGQSNMEMELMNVEGGPLEIENSNYDNIRYYNVAKIPFFDEKSGEIERQSRWKLCKDGNFNDISAVSYFFSKNLYEKLNVTIGIIGCNWGGTSATAWISEEAILEDKDIYTYKEEFDKKINGKTDEQYEIELAEYFVEYEAWCKRVEILIKEDPDISWESINEKAGICPWPQPAGRKSPYRPSGLYETMIKRVMPFSIKGFLYYQGEEDTYKAWMYGKLQAKLIKQWRCDFEDYTLPFILTQLPMYIAKNQEDDKNWAILREQQYYVYEMIKNTGLAVLIDCGEFDNIHPLDKKTVGYRLSLQALEKFYNEDIHSDGPFYFDHEIKESQIWIEFKNVESGLVCNEEVIKGFEIAGHDKQYLMANAKIEGDKIVIWNEDIIKPCYGRYAWTNYGKVNLYNKEGLPLAPFRIGSYWY